VWQETNLGQCHYALQAFSRVSAVWNWASSEAEWEYACRAGTATRFSHGDDSGCVALSDYARYNEGEQYAHMVGQKLPNPWGA
jgi:formylglycine-generating enzyme required for sulfatase activity